MKGILRSALKGGVKRIPFALVQGLANTELLSPCYHAVGDDPPAHLRHLYRYRTEDLFAGDLDFLLRHCNPVSLDEVLACIRERRALPKKAALVTFDDGLRQAGEVAAPILFAKGVPAVFFVNPAFVGNQDMVWRFKASLIFDRLQTGRPSPVALTEAVAVLAAAGYRARDLEQLVLAVAYADRHLLDKVAEVLEIDVKAYLSEVRPYLDEEELASLHQQGFSLGGHGLDHAPFSCLEPEQQVHQTVTSVNWVRERFALAYGAFAFPFNDRGVRASFFGKVADSAGVEIFFGTDYLKRDPQRGSFQRFPVEDDQQTGRDLMAWQLAKKVIRRGLARDRVSRR